MIESGTNKYIESSNIRVFPCAYRGYYNGNKVSKVFDPEARATTEANFVDTFHKVSSSKESYLISWNDTSKTLKCVIGGYYFEIYNQEIENFFYSQSGNSYPYYLCIKTVEQDLATDTTDDRSRKTNTLSSFEGTNEYLDIQKSAQYVFTGLSLRKNNSTATASLVPFANSGSGSEVNYHINYSALPLTALLDTDTGKYSLRMLGDDANTTNATGDYSIALGKHTEASGLTSVALVDNSKATDTGATAIGKGAIASAAHAVAIGQNAEATTANSVAIGEGAKAVAANQVVLGKYNKTDSTQLFIIANGNDARPAAANKFTVNTQGDVKALGNLETKGSISATGTGTNSLNLGSSANGHSGEINVYGSTASKVFTVSNTGATETAGTLQIKNTTQSDSVTSGALQVAGGVGVAKNLNVNGNTNILGNTSLNGTLSVATDKNTTLGGTLTVAKNTTLNGDLQLTGTNSATIGGNVTVGGSTTVKGDFSVTDAKSSSFSGKVSITDTAEAAGTSAALLVTGGAKISKNVIIESTTNSTSKDTGALVVKGGAGVDGDMYVNGTIYSPTGVVVKGGGANITGNATFNQNASISGDTSIGGNTTVTKTTSSTSKDNGALVVSGGVGIGENLNVGGALNLADAFTAEKAVTIKGTTAIQDMTDSSGSTSGALTVSGGVGISKNLYVGDNLVVTNDLTLNGNKSTPNTLTLGSTGTSNKGGKLVIYGAGTSTVAEVDNVGDAYFAGDLEVDGGLTIDSAAAIGGKLTIANTVEISSEGIAGLTNLVVDGKVEGHYFNATSYNTTSDRNKKCNIEDYQFPNSILSLPIKKFEFRDDSTHMKHIGCIAQDLQKICPELVTEAPDGTLSIQESKLIYALLQEVKELKNKVDLLERR